MNVMLQMTNIVSSDQVTKQTDKPHPSWTRALNHLLVKETIRRK